MDTRAPAITASPIAPVSRAAASDALYTVAVASPSADEANRM